MERITQRDLDGVLARFARAYGAPVAESWNHVGALTFYSAYGRITVHQISNADGGVRNVGSLGLCTKRELYNALHQMASVLEDAKHAASAS